MSFKQTRSTNNFPAIIRRAEPAAKEIEEEIAPIALEQAQHNAPVVTGNLRDSGEVRGNKVVFTAPYARHVELGTRFQAPRYFLHRGFNDVWSLFKEMRRGFLKRVKG
jgi:hypothetical protein